MNDVRIEVEDTVFVDVNISEEIRHLSVTELKKLAQDIDDAIYNNTGETNTSKSITMDLATKIAEHLYRNNNYIELVQIADSLGVKL